MLNCPKGAPDEPRHYATAFRDNSVDRYHFRSRGRNRFRDRLGTAPRLASPTAGFSTGTIRQTLAAPPFTMPSADTFLEVAMRPLFIFTRRPAPPIPVETTKPSMKKGQFVLTGTTVVAEGKFAHLSEKAGNKSHVVEQGKEINGILVKEIRSDRVVLTQGDETEVIVLRTAKAPPPAVAAPPASTGRRTAADQSPVPPPPPASPPEQ